MSAFHRVIALFLTVLLLPLFSFSASADRKTLSALSAKAALLMEAESGEVVYEKNASTPLPMASTTKIMTALVALELAAPDTEITVDPAAVGVEGSSVYLCAGERLTLEHLLYALLLESANDAAAAIAIGLCGSIEAFAAAMNEKAAALGLRNTHFTNPHGLDHAEHFTTAKELALIARALLKNDLLQQIVATRKITVPHAQSEGGRLLVNHNKLLRTFEGCIGIKTGFTKRSGRCLVSAAERDGVTLIAVTLDAPDDWNDHRTLLEYGFTRFRHVTLCEADAFRFSLPIVGGEGQNFVLIGNRAAAAMTLPADIGAIDPTLECRRFEFAPVKKGDLLGRLLFSADTDGDGKPELLAALPLYALSDVEQPPRKNGVWGWIRDRFF